MRTTVYSVWVSLAFGALAWLELEKRLFDDGIDVVSCPGDDIALRMGTVLEMPFWLMIKIWSLTLMIGKVAIIFKMDLLYVVETILSTSLKLLNTPLSVLYLVCRIKTTHHTKRVADCK